MSGLKRLVPAAVAVVFLILVGTILLINGIPEGTSDTVQMVFKLDAADARSVSVVGDFNNWDPQANRMARVDHLWQVRVRLKKGYTYLYNFLVDGEKWIADPTQQNAVNDQFGLKSVLEL